MILYLVIYSEPWYGWPGPRERGLASRSLEAPIRIGLGGVTSIAHQAVIWGAPQAAQTGNARTRQPIIAMRMECVEGDVVIEFAKGQNESMPSLPVT